MPLNTRTKDSLAFLSHDAAASSAGDQVDDCLLVDRARVHLGLLEFDFFRAAWRQWHGQEADERSLERAFMVYLFQQRTPIYVRALARRVVQDAVDGRLDPVALGGQAAPAPDQEMDLADPITVAVCGFLLAGLLLFIL